MQAVLALDVITRLLSNPMRLPVFPLDSCIIDVQDKGSELSVLSRALSDGSVLVLVER